MFTSHDGVRALGARRRVVRKLFTILAATAMTLGLSLHAIAPAAAAVGPADDRQKTTPTSWWTYTGVSAASVSSHLSANGARLTDIQVDNPSTPTFTVVMVKNTSSYASSWWWYYGKTQTQVSSLLTTNNARLISAQAYSTSAGTRYAVVMVKNTGTNAKAWWWYHGTTSYISTQLSTHHARLINLTPYPGGGYLALMVDNTGTNAVSGGWWWYYGVSTTALNTYLGAHHARLVDLSRNSNGTYNAVMYYNSSTRWYWYFGYSPGAAVAKANQLGERIIDATSYYVSGTKYYAVVMTNNVNSLSNKLFNIISPTVDSGVYGFYLKQVGGATLAGLQNTKQYEPASALKVLYHAKSIHQEAVGTTTDSTVITYHYNPADPTNVGICPDSYASTATTNLKNADTQMMQVSDNRMTRGILEKYTKASMLSYATSLGLTSTAINHNIGCPTSSTYNRTTLTDLGKVYEAYQNGTVTSNSTWKSQFRSRMLNDTNYSGFRSLICPIVNAEATSLGKSAATATAFCAAMKFMAKGGDYAYGGSYPRLESHDDIWLTTMPFKVSGTITPRFYVLGEFVDQINIGSTTEINNVNAARSQVKQEALRPYIRSALTTW
jgi:hypothetical protein